MELALVLGGGLFAANQMFQVLEPPTQVQLTPQQEMEKLMERPRDFALHEMNERGAIAPYFTARSGALPWDVHNPPYWMYEAGGNGPTDRPVSKAYEAIANTWEHYRRDTAEQLVKGKQYFPQQRGAKLWGAFDRELTWDGRSTNMQGFFWLPQNPTDSDRNEAAAMGKALPPDPALFTPDRYYMTATDLPFRYAPY